MINPNNKTDWQHTGTYQVEGEICFRLDHWGLGRTVLGFGKKLDEAIDSAVATIH